MCKPLYIRMSFMMMLGRPLTTSSLSFIYLYVYVCLYVCMCVCVGGWIGKSTFYNAVTRAVLERNGRLMAEVAPHPFTTIEPNIG